MWYKKNEVCGSSTKNLVFYYHTTTILLQIIMWIKLTKTMIVWSRGIRPPAVNLINSGWNCPEGVKLPGHIGCDMILRGPLRNIADLFPELQLRDLVS